MSEMHGDIRTDVGSGCRDCDRNQRRVLGSQNVSRMCMVCGVDNPLGLKGRFLELDTGELLGVFQPLEQHQGYPGRLHGGVLSAVLDETIGRSILVSSPDSWSVTVELALRYRKPVPLDREIRVLARMTRDTSRLFEGTGEILLEDGTVAVEASATYFKMPIERIAQRDFAEEWFPDDRENPESVVLP